MGSNDIHRARLDPRQLELFDLAGERLEARALCDELGLNWMMAVWLWTFIRNHLPPMKTMTEMPLSSHGLTEKFRYDSGHLIKYTGLEGEGGRVWRVFEFTEGTPPGVVLYQRANIHPDFTGGGPGSEYARLIGDRETP